MLYPKQQALKRTYHNTAYVSKQSGQLSGLISTRLGWIGSEERIKGRAVKEGGFVHPSRRSHASQRLPGPGQASGHRARGGASRAAPARLHRRHLTCALRRPRRGNIPSSKLSAYIMTRIEAVGLAVRAHIHTSWLGGRERGRSKGRGAKGGGIKEGGPHVLASESQQCLSSLA